jgi:hypothetical protein
VAHVVAALVLAEHHLLEELAEAEPGGQLGREVRVQHAPERLHEVRQKVPRQARTRRLAHEELLVHLNEKRNVVRR